MTLFSWLAAPAGRLAASAGRLAVVLGCLTAAAACEADSGPESSPGVTHQAHDSAGIEIAENSGPPAEGERWSVDPEPLLSIGGPSAPPPAMFTVVTSASRLADGTIVVLENSTSELRFFDPRGEHVRTAGGVGDGPGEFEYGSSFVRLAGDSLLVDAGDRHLLFSPTGEYIRQRPVDVLRHFSGDRAVGCTPFSLLADGSLMTCEFVSAERPPIQGPDPTARYIRVAPDGSETVLGHYWDRTGVLRMSSLAASGGSPPVVAIAPNPDYSIEMWSIDGELTRIIRRLDARPPPTDVEVDAATEQFRSMYRDEMPELEDPPDLVPAAFGLTVGTTGDLWVRRKPVVQLHDETVFDVFDTDGRFRGAVRFAGYYWLYEVGEDYVLGAWLDELGVPHIWLHGLSRGGAQASADVRISPDYRLAAPIDVEGASTPDAIVGRGTAKAPRLGQDVSGCCMEEALWGWPAFSHVMYPSASPCPLGGYVRSLAPEGRHPGWQPGGCRWGGGHSACVPLAVALMKIEEQDEEGLVSMALDEDERHNVVRLSDDGTAVEVYACSREVLIARHPLLDASLVGRARAGGASVAVGTASRPDIGQVPRR